MSGRYPDWKLERRNPVLHFLRRQLRGLSPERKLEEVFDFDERLHDIDFYEDYPEVTLEQYLKAQVVVGRYLAVLEATVAAPAPAPEPAAAPTPPKIVVRPSGADGTHDVMVDGEKVGEIVKRRKTYNLRRFLVNEWYEARLHGRPILREDPSDITDYERWDRLREARAAVERIILAERGLVA